MSDVKVRIVPPGVYRDGAFVRNPITTLIEGELQFVATDEITDQEIVIGFNVGAAAIQIELDRKDVIQLIFGLAVNFSPSEVESMFHRTLESLAEIEIFDDLAERFVKPTP